MMTTRDRYWLEFDRSHQSIRRVLVLSAIVLAGAVLGYSTQSTGGSSHGAAPQASTAAVP
jgi:hypothetical protein